MNQTRNFSAGPGALPEAVLAEAQRAVMALPGTGISILGLSHRSRQFRDMLDEAEARLRDLLALPADYRVLFLQGGGTLQFSMVPMAMLPNDRTADYIVGGYWSRNAADAARHHGHVRVVWDGSSDGFRRLPDADQPLGRSDAAYLHYVSNETVEGLQFRKVPAADTALVCDASSDFLSRPLDVRPFSLVYAHAQKNLGPAGVTIVLVRDEVLARVPPGLAPVLDYRAHADARSLLHTPAVFSIYVVLLSLRWLADEVGGLSKMGAINAEKAAVVRNALQANAPFYSQEIDPGSASDVNVVFRCATPELDALFVARAEQAGLLGTEGHRSRGGLRISLYNGVTLDDANAAAAFLSEFAHARANNIRVTAERTRSTGSTR
ncbi:MAG TPA: 3-phosphoserine/phosphohydroxythreonine transaminase [Polyangiaceae bacterium]|jgi:phosphoserine aminotransferase|nr:3-phosphoserine/phosphohydroxythreonine transaminase [Polyangiaceae bacterium]